MISRRFVYSATIGATAMSFFTLGVVHTRRATQDASYDAKLEATIRAEVRSELGKTDRTAALVPAATTGHASPRSESPDVTPSAASRARMVAEIKKELQQEMGLVPVALLRDRRSSFVELYSYDKLGKANYGTAGYLGNGYFITVKHAVVALKDDDGRQSTRKIASVKIVYKGKQIPAKVVDTGDADVGVHSGDWAIIKTRADVDLPALRVDSAFAYDFADPIFRLGNDYSKGIILSTGYVGQRTSNGLVTCLTDGHPGVSGGGVLDQRGNLVGIPIGRMQGDYRFSFILPIRAEMLRKLPNYEQPEPIVAVAAAAHQQQ
jgi:Trypsin-like peptidase domain